MGGQMTNQQAQVLVKQFLKTGSCDVFDELWSSTVMMVNPYKYFDPSGLREGLEKMRHLSHLGGDLGMPICHF